MPAPYMIMHAKAYGMVWSVDNLKDKSAKIANLKCRNMENNGHYKEEYVNPHVLVHDSS